MVNMKTIWFFDFLVSELLIFTQHLGNLLVSAETCRFVFSCLIT